MLASLETGSKGNGRSLGPRWLRPGWNLRRRRSVGGAQHGHQALAQTRRASDREEPDRSAAENRDGASSGNTSDSLNSAASGARRRVRRCTNHAVVVEIVISAAIQSQNSAVLSGRASTNTAS